MRFKYLSILVKNQNFWKKLKLLVKKRNFGKKQKFWGKNKKFSKKPKLLETKEILVRNRNFYQILKFQSKQKIYFFFGGHHDSAPLAKQNNRSTIEKNKNGDFLR